MCRMLFFYAIFMWHIWIYCIAEDGNYYVRMIFGNGLFLAQDKDRCIQASYGVRREVF